MFADFMSWLTQSQLHNGKAVNTFTFIFPTSYNFPNLSAQLSACCCALCSKPNVFFLSISTRVILKAESSQWFITTVKSYAN